MADDFSSTTSTTGRLLPGGRTTGVIDSSVDDDWFAINLNRSTQYVFRLDSAAGAGLLSDPVLALYNNSGVLIDRNDDFNGLNSQLTFTPGSTGVYFLSARGFAGAMGAYQLTSTAGTVIDDYTATSATTGRLNPGASVSGNVETASDHDWFAVSLTAGRRYVFGLSPASSGGLSDPYLSLYAANGTLITSNDDSNGSLSSQIEYTATTSGTYYLDASGLGSLTGGYLLSSSTGSVVDDYLASSETSGRVSPGSSVTGNIEVTNDHDWFAISLVAGQSYRFTLNSATTGGLGDPYLSLYSASGALLASNDDSGGTLASTIDFSATVSGTYYLDATGLGGSTGGYVLAASASGSTPTVPVPTQPGGDDYAGNSSTAGRLTVGAALSGNVETAGDRDWFAVSLNAGTTYTISVDPASTGGLGDPFLRLYSSGNTSSPVAYDDDSGSGLASLLSYTPTVSGIYFVEASAYSAGTGGYQVRVAQAGSGGSGPTGGDDYAGSTATAGRLTPGASVNGNVEISGDQDWFAISLTAGRRYAFNLDPQNSGGLSDTVLSLYSSQGTLLQENDDANGTLASAITFDATQSGTFYLGARGYASSTGAYRLTSSAGVALDDYGSTTSNSGFLSVGSPVTGNIETSGDTDWFRVSLQAGVQYRFNLDHNGSGGLGDPVFELYSSSGSFLASNDDANGSAASQLLYTPTTSGTYYAAARGFSTSTGAYRLSASSVQAADDYAADASTSGRLATGSSVSGTIERVSDQDWFAINLTVGQRYTFNLDPAQGSGLSDPYLTLYSSSGATLAVNDDFNGLASQITYTAGTTGTYYLGARGYGSAVGAYSLRASGPTVTDDYASNSGTTGRVVVGQSSSGRIETAGDADWFAVTLSAGQNYRFNLNPSSSGGLADTYLQLYSSTGALLASNDDANGGRASEINFSASSGGTYFLSASGFGSDTGSYQISAASVSRPTASGFSIDIDFSGDSRFQSYFATAAQRWASVITGDVPDFNGVDDLRISASVSPIDGVGRILGQAGPRGLRPDSLLPYSGVMNFDSADVESMVSNGTFGDVVLHEMGHVLGILGYLFQQRGLLNSSNSYQYTGANGVSQFRSVYSQAGSYVPLETSGGSGTAGSHWSESLFDRELMTGYAESSAPMPLSVVTIGALQDLGYSVNYGAADSFRIA